jgi:hypothetical protein
MGFKAMAKTNTTKQPAKKRPQKLAKADSARLTPSDETRLIASLKGGDILEVTAAHGSRSFDVQAFTSFAIDFMERSARLFGEAQHIALGLSTGKVTSLTLNHTHEFCGDFCHGAEALSEMLTAVRKLAARPEIEILANFVPCWLDEGDGERQVVFMLIEDPESEVFFRIDFQDTADGAFDKVIEAEEIEGIDLPPEVGQFVGAFAARTEGAPKAANHPGNATIH